MIQPQELRIGNYVLDKYGKRFQVKQIHYKKLTRRFPIPLTEEWLVKFGFEKGLHTKTGWYKYGLNVKEQGVNFFLAHRVWIKHVHQLQNLYYALTGEELKRK